MTEPTVSVPRSVLIDRDLLSALMADASLLSSHVSHARAQAVVARLDQAQALLDAGAGDGSGLKPFISFIESHDADTFARLDPDDTVIATHVGSWGAAKITLGDLRALTNQPKP